LDETIAVPLAKDCIALEDLGTYPGEEDIYIFFTTTCSYQRCLPGERIERHYVQNIDGTYRKQLPSQYGGQVLEYRQYAGSLRAQTQDELFFSVRTDGTLEVLGNKILEDSSMNYAERTSPNNRWNARLLETENPGRPFKAIVEIENLNTNDVQTYDFTDQVHELEGVYIDSWDAGGENLYVAGGIYEFSAPAKLWKITPESQNVQSYPILDGKKYPVNIQHEEDLVFVTSGEVPFEIEQRSDIQSTISLIRLSTGDTVMETTIKGVVSSLLFNADNKGYFISQVDEERQNLYTLNYDNYDIDLVKENIELLSPSRGYYDPTTIDDKISYIAYVENDTVIVENIQNGTSTEIGEASKNNCNLDELGKRYVHSVDTIVNGE
jgi:hypothetical protein